MDQIVYDMSAQSETEPNIFVKKDWISILDNQNGVYSSNQAVIDTSQLSNSNKWISYRESYLTIPMQLTVTGATLVPQTVGTSVDYALSLKNWYGSIIHSISVDLAGTTIIQQTPFQSLWNNFKLLTTLSYQDLLTIGPSIGFYPDNSSSWNYNTTVGNGQLGVSNNHNLYIAPVVSAAHNALESYNNGFYQRQRAWNFNSIGLAGGLPSNTPAAYSALMSIDNLRAVYRSNVTKCAAGVWQASITATVLLRHLHSFFNAIPLCKGVFMKITLNLNNSVVNFTSAAASPAGNIPITQNQAACSFPLGGVCPLMIAGSTTGQGAFAAFPAGTFIASLAVGARPIESSQAAAGVGIAGPLANMTLSAPSYTFNPVYEQAYLSNPVRKIDYSDIYQYQVLNIAGSANFNNLITNGIAGIKSVLIIPFHSPVAGVNASISPLQSVFDSAAGGTTSPLSYLSNFNVMISGQNAIYNSQRYTYEEFLNQLNGQNGVNGSQVDGMSSGLISQLDFENMYNYYYVNVERCLPNEKGVSKSVNIIGQNMSAVALDLYVFVEYSVSISLNLFTGSRV